MTRALVLSGGGPVGIAWETGIVAGLLAEGIDVRAADTILGTSAGSLVGAQLAEGQEIDALYRRAASGERFGSVLARTEQVSAELPERMARLAELMTAAGEAPDESAAVEARRRTAEFALASETATEEQFVAVYEPLVGPAWPSRFRCTAVDVETGALRVWQESDGVDVRRAVASSCAVPGVYPPVTIQGRRYMDGGMRSGANTDAVAGHDHVLLVTLTWQEPSDDPRLLRYQRQQAAEVAAVESAGGTVTVIGPTRASLRAMGIDLMDYDRTGPAAEAGLAQGRDEAARLSDSWT